MSQEAKNKGVLMKLQDIQKLIDMLDGSNLEELDLETGGMKIRLLKRRNPPAANPGASQPQVIMVSSPGAPAMAPMHAAPVSGPVLIGTEVAPEEALAPIPARSKTAVEVKSPMVGTFYRSPAPGAEPFVKIGDRVKKGQTLCIIEAMKLMNEIECETDGVVVDIIPENAQPVEYGEALLHIEPAT
jgi:acetyl-CoA carboxylase biotin carboxyl carrier protein